MMNKILLLHYRDYCAVGKATTRAVNKQKIKSQLTTNDNGHQRGEEKNLRM
jgi:hypothetical protein